jgi:PIN domain nuclease of toxin-antitoxin system
MVNYLLDTHTLIWAIFSPEKLSHQVVQAFNGPENTFFISTISLWEISLKFSIGKLALDDIDPDEIPDLALRSGFQIISLAPEESTSYHKLKLTDHKDPFDRMLIWQAIRRNMVLITKDKSIPLYKESGLKTLW